MRFCYRQDAEDDILGRHGGQPFKEGTPHDPRLRLVYPISQHTPPQIWEFEQPYIGNLIWNARTFQRFVVYWYFKNWAVLDRDNRRIWETYYRPKPLFDHLPTWQEWLREYRQLIIAVQEMVEDHTAQGT